MKPVLMILTSHAALGDTGKPTGLWAEEFTTPYYALIDAGVSVALASPRGGKSPFAEGSVKDKPGDNPASVQRFLKDADAQTRFAETATTASLSASDFSAVFLPGGHGTMWDTASDAATARLVADTFNAHRPVGAVCHGAAGLVNAKRGDGQSIVKGLKVNAFTNAEETAVGLMEVVPFHLESRLRELGGEFVAGPMWGEYAVRDGVLITGQNPASSEKVAQLLLQALGDAKLKQAA